MITREQGYVTWEDAFLCLQSELLPDAIRAKFCELIIGSSIAFYTLFNTIVGQISSVVLFHFREIVVASAELKELTIVVMYCSCSTRAQVYF